MPETKPHTAQPKPAHAWTEEEKTRGAEKPEPGTPAGEATTAGRPNDDRAKTEGAAAATKATPPRP